MNNNTTESDMTAKDCLDFMERWLADDMECDVTVSRPDRLHGVRRVVLSGGTDKNITL